MASFKPLPDNTLFTSEEVSEDVKYWKHLEYPVDIQEHGPVTHLEFSPVKPYNFLVTSSATVKVHRNNAPYSVVTSLKGFKEIAYSGSYRFDGKLIVAGGGHGVVQVFKDKTALRQFHGHTGDVHLARFTSSNFHLFSGSDDKTVRVWDLGTGAELICFNENQDYIRCGAASLSNKDIIAAGSYDSSIKLFDIRTKRSVLTVDHKEPVESVLIHPAGGLMISAGGNSIKVWDYPSGGRLLTSLETHHKTVTSLCYSSNYQRLISGSLDRHVKFYDVTDYKVKHNLEYPSAVLSLGVAPDDSVIAVGMSSGLLSIKTRRDSAEIEAEKQMQRKAKNKRTFWSTMTVKTYVPDKDDIFCEHKRKQPLERYDKYFKHFRATDAFNEAMNIRLRSMNPETTITVIQEVVRRDALRSCLAGRDDASVADILKFLNKNYCRHEFRDTIIDVLNALLDVYGDNIAFMLKSCEELEKLKMTVDLTLKSEMLKSEIAALLEAVLSASSRNYTQMDLGD